MPTVSRQVIYKSNVYCKNVYKKVDHFALGHYYCILLYIVDLLTENHANNLGTETLKVLHDNLDKKSGTVFNGF